MKLNDLKLNDEKRIKCLKASDDIKRRLMDIGFTKGVKVKPVIIKKNIRAYMIKNTVISVRCVDTLDIEVEV